MPPLMEQAEELWRSLPEKIEQAQEFLIRMGILREPITLERSGAAGAHGRRGAQWRPTIFSYVRNVVGGLFGFVTILLLTFYMLVESREIFAFFVRLFPREAAGRVAGDQQDGDSEGERVARRAAAAVAGHRRVPLRSACGRWACRISTCSRSSPPSAR